MTEGQYPVSSIQEYQQIRMILFQNFPTSKLRLLPPSRHCEERSDEAISTSSGVEPVCVHRTGRPLGSSKSAIPETPKYPYSVLRCHSLACGSPEPYVEGTRESMLRFTVSGWSRTFRLVKWLKNNKNGLNGNNDINVVFILQF
jgi:hypothetical protein